MSFDVAALTAALRTRIIGRQLLFAETMASTNQTLLDEAKAGRAVAGRTALCERQTAGRGRQRRLWHSPTGLNLYFSVLWESRQPPERMPQLAMVAALALREALAAAAPEAHIGLKWPNDLWDGAGRKLSGILCECPPWRGETRQAVIGIGVNVNAAREDFPPELAATAGSLHLATGRVFNREALLASILNYLETKMLEWETSVDFKAFTAEWDAHDILKGRTIAVEMPGSNILHGKVLGVDATGLLRLQEDDGAVTTVTAGDVHLRMG